MSNVEDVINKVMIMVKENGNDLKTTLQLVLNDYNLEKKTTEIVSGNDNIYYLKKFIGTKKVEGKSDLTLKQYIRENNNFLLWVNKSIDKVTKDDILAYLAYIQINKNVKMTTVTNSKRYLSAFFNWLDDEGYILKSPTRNLKSIKCCKNKKQAFTTRELDLLRNGTNNSRDKALVELLNSTGCRVSEVSGINREDINWNDKSILISGKGNKERYVYFDDITAMYLEKYLKERTDYNNALFVGLNRKHERFLKSGIESTIRNLGEKLKIKSYPHKFRRTYATRALQNGMSLSTLEKLMGHEKVDTTMIYCDIGNKQIQMDYMKHME